MTLQSFLCLIQVLYLLGTLVIAMSLQLDRRGIWNMMGPCLLAFVIMAFMWVRSQGRLWKQRASPSVLFQLSSLGPNAPPLLRASGGTHRSLTVCLRPGSEDQWATCP